MKKSRANYKGTVEKEKELIQLYNVDLGSISKLKIYFDTSHATIRRKLNKLGIIIVNRQNELNGTIEEITKRYSSGETLEKLSKEFKSTVQAMSRHLKKQGVTVKNRRICNGNNTIFSNINTEEKAYWLGFIFADGYIAYGSSKFEISLQLKDINHLYKFNNFVECDRQNTKHDNYRCRGSISDKMGGTILYDYGCTPRKSLTLKFPDKSIFQSEELVRHFIRGYFDGDGCVSRYISPKTVTPTVSLLGTKNFLEKIIEYSDIKNFKFYHHSHHSDETFDLKLSKDDGIKFINYLYKDSVIYLDRKYKLYQFFKNGSRSLQEGNELLQTNIGELGDGNTEINLETKESKSSYSVETETEKSE